MKITTISWTIIALTIIAGILVYPLLPNMIISHWNAQGIADGYSSRLVGLFLIPLISIAILILFLLIPKIDPLKKNIQKFRKHYDLFILFFVIFTSYIQALTITANLGIILNITLLIIPAIGILFFFIGIVLEKAKRNWFLGIRTPWTLSSDKVWNETHKIGSKLFKLSGIIAIIGIFFGNFAIWFTLVPIMISTIFLVIYSYLLYRNVKNPPLKWRASSGS